MAATVVDALVVTLGLDLTAFKRGKADASKATKSLTTEEKEAAKEIEAANKRAGESFKQVRNEVLALVAIFTAGMGIKNFTESTINSAASLGFMAKNLDMSTRELSAWQRAAERAGGSAEGITNALQASQQEVAKFKLGQVSDSQQWFLRFGGSVKDLKDGNSYLLARSRIIAGLFKTDPGRARLVAQQMGIGDGEFNLLKQGPQAVLALVAAQQKNSAITEKQAAQALKLKNEWLDFTDRLKYTGTTILLELMPIFEKWLQKLQAMADWVADHKGDISKWVDNAVAAVQRFVEWADKAAESVGGWKNVLIALAGIKILSMVSPILQLAAALGGLGTSLGIIGTVGPAAIAALAGLGIAKALGLPDTDKTQGEKDVANGDWLAASTHLPAMDFIKAVADHFTGALSDKLGNSSDLRQKAGPDAVQAALKTQWKYGVPADVTLAQFGLESSFGKHMPPGSNNPFGIHATGNQPFVWGYDWDANGKRVPTKFAKYGSIDEAFDAHGKLLATGAAYAEARRHLDDPMAYAAALTGHYATDPLYGAKLQAMIGAPANATQLAQQHAALIARQGIGARDVTQAPSNVSTSTSSAETNINGPITIHTQATDAEGIARSLGGALGRYSFTVPQANMGVS
ncbi:glycoside hydrolase family 73 protein [Paraburkholderia saeva]|uniref:glycoside hydrolase family 73 protein n=1 Tax=Paraburkholderia saeva TaxID=2777537 RepID=UPI001D44BE4F|nr:glucosaminidase domain-containing protein [Paraburkholderia saeva]CAG4887996.1 hypothetical protein R52603_00553 [Paraburkholderia saeva]